jgi:hypothetical protein
LINAQATLFELRLQDGDLMTRSTQTRFSLRDVRLRLFHARLDLIVVKCGDHLAGLDLIAFSHGDLTNASGGLRGHRRVVAFDAPAYRNDFPRRVRLAQKEPPGQSACNEQNSEDGAKDFL